MAGTVQSVLGVGATLGEGPIWFEDAVWFVDIKGRRVHRFVPATGAARSWDMGAEVGWILPAATGGMIVGLQTGLHRFDPASGALQLLHRPEPGLPGNRLNDATTDAQGRLWFGSMDNGETAATGRLHRCADGHCSDAGLPPVVITNGPAISVDGRTLYHVDTLGRTIWRVPIHDDASLGTPVRHVTIEDGAGYPDGPTIDAEDHLWIGLFGGWGVRRYDQAGKLVGSMRFPVANVTKMTFGGADLRTAYATTAAKGLRAAERAAQPQAGDLFAFDPGVQGIRITAAKI
ncbi:SMP-30/gluconolactonase/LRE family protein [Polymorphobacter fuscus]|uniref:SMP-30/gluconolactonase/LRE family protein n=1 Tax=Sandarakinorhabdus fusca TaxID=1439888 RepID=A0A7C9GQI7_9SPHN|nr:SMP-30/gluconolactonase/LRE family protein [Polymorphobacter fuscus]KAB7644075.1 SMP-30/gluconolactonase/LRE family protein [Polymorphobacter fuscus]MQT18452.1 SMP-30/gluconolactonase/LRE family protein [Polymorphobacter fuscus]NJC08427.1 sugar lactone lactonase YvrE [Polymorphobacter fuscus]